MATPSNNGTLGTFTGVFTPSILTILGIILFLRLGFSVGNAGLRNALIIIGIATAVSVITSVSLSAIATNMEVRGGGDYYMISRTLGVEFGGAIGIVLFLAQSVSIAFYAIGFGEALTAVLGSDTSWLPQAVAAGAVLFLFLFAWAGADVASRFQFVVMALLIAALASFYLGAIGGFSWSSAGRSLSAPPGSLPFWAIFAIFFPAVTGFTQGVSMSGDLSDPSRSLVKGTFAAVGLSTIVYVSVAILLAGNLPLRTLSADNGALGRVAAFSPLIDAGVIAATLSSAMASFLGGPRIMQALAADRVFPVLSMFSKGHGPTANPRRAVLLSLGIALGTIAAGDLDVIAPVVSMFFLISYGLLNYATYYEARAASPSFRPRFRFFDRRVSLLGALLCLGAMVAINPIAGGAAVAVMAGIHQYLRRRNRQGRWADASRAFYFQKAKEAILAMTSESAHPRNWRPQILAFSADPLRRERLLQFAAWLEGGSGLSAAVAIVVGDGPSARQERARVDRELQTQIDELGLDVYARVVMATDPMEALPVIVQSFGLGPVGANTVLFGWPEDPQPERMADFRTVVRDVMRFGVGVVTMSSDAERWEAMEATPRRERTIDVWWQADDDSSRLALLSAYLFTRTAEWGRARIRLLSPPLADESPAVAEARLSDLVERVRIPAEVVVVGSDAEVEHHSSAATFVFMSARRIRGDLLGPSGTPLAELFPRLPLSAAFLAAVPLDLEAGPETGHHAAIAAAEDRLETARRRLSVLEAQRARIESEIAEMNRLGAGGDPALAAAMDDASDRLTDVGRRVAKAKARVDSAEIELAKEIAREK